MPVYRMLQVREKLDHLSPEMETLKKDIELFRKAANEYRVRIPAATADDAGITPERGDILVLGAVASVSCIKDVSAYTGFVVQIVSDNRRGRFQHWAVSGE